MKRHIQYTLLLFSLLLTFNACSDDDDNKQVPAELSTIQALIENHILLKNTVLEDNTWSFDFETQTITYPAEAIQSVTPQKEEWTTLVTFTNGTTMSIPTIGTSIDKFINNTEVNPSGYNPLSAKVLLNLPTLGRVKVIIKSKKGNRQPDVEHLYNSIEKVQSVLVLGLYQNYNNEVVLIYTDKSGNERARTTIHIQTGSLDISYLPTPRVTTANITKMEPGMNLVNSPGLSEADTSCPYMVDADGEIRWLLDWRNSKELNHIGAQCGLHRMKNGNYITGDFNNHQIVEVNTLGEIVHRWDLQALGYSFHHEIMEASNDKLIIAVSKNTAMLADGSNLRILDHAIELDPMTGNVTKEWDFVQMLDSSRINKVDADVPGSSYYGQSKSNWLHNNGINESNGEMVATARWQGIFKYDYTGSLKWVIAPHNNWKESYKKFLLTPLDKEGKAITDTEVLNGLKSHPDFEWVWGVHCPVILPNGHIMAFDNGYCRNYNSKSNEIYSRAVEYEINEKEMTIRQVWQYGKERGKSCYASAISGVQYLDKTGNRLFCPGTGCRFEDGQSGARIIEIAPQTQEVVFELELATNVGMVFHRANRISLYPENL